MEGLAVGQAPLAGVNGCDGGVVLLLGATCEEVHDSVRCGVHICSLDDPDWAGHAKQ
jgi:hypothetical protein